MSTTKSTGKFAEVYRTDKGIVARITDDIVLSRGQTVYFNDYEESINFLVEKNIITASEGQAKKESTAKRDREFNRETIYSLNAKPAKDATNGTKKAD